MSVGLTALLDDVAALAKVAAASLDDAGLMVSKAGVKAVGIVIDDTAVTPRYVVGFAAARELPIIGRIALGSAKNKILLLLPAALGLSLVAPWAITPLLMGGGAYLCYEGAEKVVHQMRPGHAHGDAAGPAPVDALALEEQKVRGAIQTDFILSAEIMAITLGSVAGAALWLQALVLAVVGLGITGLVYGVVAIIVKADDAGLAMARSELPGPLRPVIRALGRGLVTGMPMFLSLLGAVGTAAMIWVGGGILLHGLEAFGLGGPSHALHEAAVAAGHLVPAGSGLIEWAVTAAGSGLAGLAVGALLIPLVCALAGPATTLLRRLRGS